MTLATARAGAKLSIEAGDCYRSDDDTACVAPPTRHTSPITADGLVAADKAFYKRALEGLDAKIYLSRQRESKFVTDYSFNGDSTCSARLATNRLRPWILGRMQSSMQSSALMTLSR